MKLLTRDTSAYRFLTLGGLFSRKQLPTLESVKTPVEFSADYYRAHFDSFGVDESNVEKYLIGLLKQLGWDTVQKKHDIWAEKGEDCILIECKSYNPKVLFLEDYKGGARGENAQEQVQRYLKTYPKFKWAILTDCVNFRLYYNGPDPSYDELFIEFCLKDIIDSQDSNPYELRLLIDILSAGSELRAIDPTERGGLSDKQVATVIKCLAKHKRGFRTVMKSLFVAALEDMGIRPIHHDLLSVRNSKTKKELQDVFLSIPSSDSDFHNPQDFLSETLAGDIHVMFNALADVDFYHVDHEFFGTIYQKYINNGNASHYTNSDISKEMANYIANRNQRTQRTVPPTRLGDDDYLLDPALGSGQLLRGLLPYHRVFFGGKSKGVEGWRQLARRFVGRDIDEVAIWVAKLNIWLSTAQKGSPNIKLDQFKRLNVIEAVINRGAGRSIKEAFEIPYNKNIVACVSNPPWDALKGDKRRKLKYDKDKVKSIKQSLSIEARQLNYAQIFLRIIYLLGLESRHMRFSIILPDNFFIDQNDALRRQVEPHIDFYFSFPRNKEPLTKRKIFKDIDATRKFGIIFGRSGTDFESVVCYPCGISSGIRLDTQLMQIGNHLVYPLFSSAVQAKIIRSWKGVVNRYPTWNKGEYDPSQWDRTNRTLGTRGRNKVIGGDSFCDKSSAWSTRPNTSKAWKKFQTISKLDKEKRNRDRSLFSDYINNSAKKNSASFLEAADKCNLKDAVLYSFDCSKEDSYVFDSLIYSVFVECYATSQHMSAWRLQALGAPPPKKYANAYNASLRLCKTLDLSLSEAIELYTINEDWIGLSVPKEKWCKDVGKQVASAREIESALKMIGAEIKKRRMQLGVARVKKKKLGRN